MQNPFIYIRGLRHVDHTVFVVAEGQKRYWDENFQCWVAYSSGQQVKRSILEETIRTVGKNPAPVTFYFEAPKLKEKEVTTPADPNYVDQLLGGWMIAQSGGSGRTIKRRSPLSISALRPLHPLMSKVYSENISFDRSDRPDIHKVIVKDQNGNKLTEEQITELLSGSDRSLRRKWIQDNKRTSGLFIYDIAIDLRTLFSISKNKLEPELSEDMIKKLKNEGWIESKNVFGPCLVAPEGKRNEVIEALPTALLNWRITTNQARTFSPMELLAVSVSNDANKIAGSIRAKLSEDTEKQRAFPIIDDTAGSEIFVALPCEGYIQGVHGTANAIDQAKEYIKQKLKSFNYKNQDVGKD